MTWRWIDRRARELLHDVAAGQMDEAAFARWLRLHSSPTRA